MLERSIPPLDKLLLNPLKSEHREGFTEKTYLEAIERFERNVESSLIETFGRLSIRVMVKTDPYSLPFNEEIVVTLQGESYLNGAYEIHRVARGIVKELMKRDHIYRFRFYMFINPLFPETRFNMGFVEYRFRYHIKQMDR